MGLALQHDIDMCKCRDVIMHVENSLICTLKNNTSEKANNLVIILIPCVNQANHKQSKVHCNGPGHVYI